VVKVIWHKTASPLQKIVFSRCRNCALPSGHIGATWRMRLNLCFLWPSGVRNPNGKSIGSAVSAQLLAESLYTLQLATLSPKTARSHEGILYPSNSWLLGQSETTIQTASWLVQLFSHRWPQGVPILYSGRPFPPKLFLCMGIWTPV